MAALGRFVNELEETLIAVLLGLMTVVTFANVVARYGFNSNILWALEITVFMFGWLVLLGASYAVKTHIHLGVDALINVVNPSTRAGIRADLGRRLHRLLLPAAEGRLGLLGQFRQPAGHGRPLVPARLRGEFPAQGLVRGQ